MSGSSVVKTCNGVIQFFQGCEFLPDELPTIVVGHALNCESCKFGTSHGFIGTFKVARDAFHFDGISWMFIILHCTKSLDNWLEAENSLERCVNVT